MAPRKSKAPEEIVELDRIEGQPHPRETFELVGEDEALARAARAIRSGRVPQGWLITGAPGVGKATLAYRIARYVLKYGAKDAGPADLSVPENDPVSLQVAAGSHPGLLVLKRATNPETGKPMSVLSVAEIRRLSGFFGMTSGAGGWRVAIIDTADDMNDAAANALLKALEEPPARAMLILLANAPGRLLPTIRSRCQRLELRPLAEDVLDRELARRMPELSSGERASVTRLAGGSLGLALRLAGGDGLALAVDADRLIEGAGSPDLVALMDLSDRVARVKDGLETLGDFLALTLSERIRARARAGEGGLKPWLDAWERLRGLFVRANALHLEPRQTILTSAHALEEPARRGRL
jgi:DNA polymerase-3 subunit delta'